MKLLPITVLVLISWFVSAQEANIYRISFENAAHHEALIKVSFYALKEDTVSLRMSRTSPGRYALHEFAKNVYDVKVTNSKGKSLKIDRPDPYQWKVTGHDGEIQVSYRLYANRGDGTYSQIDETHAHLNMPATFMYIPTLRTRPIEIQFYPREDLQWKVATQLKPIEKNRYYAPDLDYFMDSPTEISNHEIRSFKENQNGENYTIHLIMHHNGTPEELDLYFEQVKAIVKEEKKVYGELPSFDYKNYYFLACYLPNVSGDGMEHRNSTILTSTRSLDNGGMKGNIGTVAHEFFHAWNVERIRPASLEPFDYTEANMSGELWFAEGFTSYYTNLILCRAGIISQKEYIEGLSSTFNYVWNSPGRSFFNPVEMSYQAPFVDAATSVDEVNRSNTFISYYSYGSMLGLALDLSLRNYKEDLNLDDFMKFLWLKFGKKEINYTINDLRNNLNEYAGGRFGNDFFEKYIFNSNMPDYQGLFKSVGVGMEQDKNKVFWGFESSDGFDYPIISQNTEIGSPAYDAGLEKGDVILSARGVKTYSEATLNSLLHSNKPGDSITLEIKRNGVLKTVPLILGYDPSYTIYPIENKGEEPSASMLEKRDAWLGTKQ